MSPVGPTPAPQAESEPKAGENAVPDPTGSSTPAKATSDGIAKAALERLGRALAGLVRRYKHRADLHGSGGSPQAPLPKNRSSFLSINLGKLWDTYVAMWRQQGPRTKTFSYNKRTMDRPMGRFRPCGTS
jgi:hypothetical protein